MKRRMMLTNSAMDDEPATPQPATPNPGQPRTPQPNMGGHGKMNSKIGSKGGMTPVPQQQQQQQQQGGKLGGQQMMQQHPFSPQTPNQFQMGQQQHMGQQQQQDGACRPHVPPAGAVAAAQEVVDIATRQITTPSSNVGNSKPQVSV